MMDKTKNLIGVLADDLDRTLGGVFENYDNLTPIGKQIVKDAYASLDDANQRIKYALIDEVEYD